MPVFHVAQLMGISTRLLEAAGVPPETARQVAASLIEGNLAGHDSHGVIRLTQYVRGMERGQIDPHAQLEVLRETSTTALIDAHWAFGQIAARRRWRSPSRRRGSTRWAQWACATPGTSAGWASTRCWRSSMA